MTTKFCAVVSLLLAAGTASALAPFGDGTDGSLSVTSTVALGPDVDRDDSQATPAGSTSIKLTVNSGVLNPGEEILIVDTQGADAGNYEFATTLSAVGGVYTLTAPLANTYSAGTRVAKVFQYTSFGVTNTGTVTGANGLIAIRSQAAMVLGGGIDVNGTGHVGGSDGIPGQNGEQGDSSLGSGSVATAANGNGGGGGLTFAGGPAGGGGGGYGTVGTAGQDPTSNATPGAAGGTVGDAQLTTIHFGGGGGGGAAALLGGPSAGGDGGGIVYLAAPSITIGPNGGVVSNGTGGTDGVGSITGPYAASGGGAGGTIFIQTGTGGFINNGGVTATGGLGGDGGVGSVTTGDGGNGGLGRIRVDGPISGVGPILPAVGFNGAAVTEPAAAKSGWNVYE